MSEDADDDDSKTHEPTEKKLQEAAERGDVPVSREAALLASLLATLAIVSLALRDNAARLAEVLTRLLDDPGGWSLRNGSDAAALIDVLVRASAGFVLPIFGILLAAGLAASFAQHAPSAVLDRIRPQLSRISPASGLKRLVGRTGFVEFVKSSCKMLAMAFVAGLVLQGERNTIADTLFVSPAVVPDRILTLLAKLLSGVTAAFLLVAGVDLVWTRMSWRKRMRMSRQDIKDEMKNAEGDPMMKARRRSLALDRARRRMFADIPRATIVITNPTHYAIALRYRREEGGAPLVVAKGQDLIALKIREIAGQHGISIVENKLLARSMYDHAQVGDFIPPDFYKAVAEVIHYIQSRNARHQPSPADTVMH